MTRIVAVAEKIDTAGVMVYWSFHGIVDREKLEQALREQGIPEEEWKLPALPEPETCLRRAVKEQRNSRRLIRPLKHRRGWAVVQEKAGDEENEYENDLTVKLDKVGRVAFKPQLDTKIEAAIEEAYKRHLYEFTTGDLSRWLLRKMEDLMAITLRDVGGVYFIPREGVTLWQKISKAVAASSTSRIYSIPALKAEDTVEAITEAIILEAQTEAKRMEGELTGEEELGSLALRNRSQKCQEVLKKVERYERLLDTKLDKMREQLSELQVNISAAMIAAEVREEVAA